MGLHEGRTEIREKVLRQTVWQETLWRSLAAEVSPRVVGAPQEDIQGCDHGIFGSGHCSACEASSRPSRYLAVLAIVSLRVTLTLTRRTYSGYANVVGYKATQYDIVI